MRDKFMEAGGPSCVIGNPGNTGFPEIPGSRDGTGWFMVQAVFPELEDPRRGTGGGPG